MAFFPMFVDLKNELCIIIGGGMVAYRKIKALLEFEAKVVVISPQFCDNLLALKGDITLINRKYETSDLEGALLVIAATDDIILNKRISSECKERKIPINVVDVQKECSFIFPAYLKKGAITVGVTSSGKSPLISQRIKKDINNMMPVYLETLVEILGEVRDEVKEKFDTEEKRKKVYKKLIEAGTSNQGKLSRIEIENILNNEKEKLTK